MTAHLLILADDLTGATDTAVQFVLQGLPAAVALTGNLSDLNRYEGVLALDTESRHCTPETAYKRVTAAVIEAKKRGICRFYKKIDSTFRGNVGAELEALMQASGMNRLMLVPALPRGNRTTRNGRQYVGGTLLHETAFAQDPCEPATESHIPSILARQTSYPVHCIDRQALESFDAASERRSGIFVFDAETDDDLAGIAARCSLGAEEVALAGAAGFAEMVAKALLIKRDIAVAVPSQDRLFVINGSLNAVSERQVETARRRGIGSAFLSPAAAMDAGADADRDLVEKTVFRLNAEGKALLSTPFTPLPGVAPGAGAWALGRTAAAILEQVPDVNVVVMGGDTSFAVCKVLGIRTLLPRAQICPGLTVCIHDTRAFLGPLVVKSGGFGPDDAIGMIQDFLSRRHPLDKRNAIM
ncbi:MAG: four-carbon acid sugar kinase family protein [Chitinispirillaceae bacterium]|nr:four-carbon acid sugar kinase family protein [Chitinispirillaceae bacterium]